MAENTPALAAQSPESEASATSSVRESDNAFMRAALFLGSSIVHAPSVVRGAWKYYGKNRLFSISRFFNEYRPHPALYIAVALVVFAGASFTQTHQLATGVSVNGTYVGAVSSPDTFRHAYSYVKASASRALGYDYTFENDSVRTYPVFAANDKLLTEGSLVTEICDATSTVSYSSVLKVDGQTVGSSDSPDAIESALSAKLNSYVSENTISAEFVQDLQIGKEIVPESKARTISSISDIVNATSQEEVIYTVKAGDTWSQIAARYDMSSKGLLALNPECDMDLIHEGQELTVSAAVPLLSVRVVDRIQYQAPIAYDTEYVDDSSMYQGQTKVITKGVNGLANVDAHVTTIDGVETSRNVISSTTVKEPVAQVMAKGTKERPKTVASGSFAWPVSGRLTSTFGGRASPGGIGSTNHKGIDIAKSRGATIKAADGGTVSYAGWMGGYGYLVIIDHNNGYQTYYGHNSKLSVTPGTKVYKGQKIAEMGSTGNSTGNHCHFEIRFNGTPTNPLKYLP